MEFLLILSIACFYSACASAGEIVVMKGLTTIHVHGVSRTAKLSVLRKKLKDKGKIPGTDTSTEAWRFVDPEGLLEGGVAFSDIVYAKKTEGRLTIDYLLSSSAKIYLSNTKKDTPDFVGMEVKSFTNRRLSVTISKLNGETNNYMEPIMLTEVTSTNENVAFPLKDVVICEKSTPVQFDLTVKGHSGFGFSITPRSGDYIVDKMYSTGDDVSTNTQVTIQVYQEGKNKIVISDTESLNIPSYESIGYTRITCKVWKLTSYKKGGRTINVQNSSRYKRANVFVPSESVQSATATRGDVKNADFGTISDVVENMDELLGEVVMYFLVFRNREAAEKVIGFRRPVTYG